MNKQTQEFLDTCQKYGLKRVCICVAHEIVPESVRFTFGPRGSVFGIKTLGSEARVDGWPAIWRVVNDLKISGGAGNSNQHQITWAAQNSLEHGAYRFYAGKWKKLD